jgi:hypothetical protein
LIYGSKFPHRHAPSFDLRLTRSHGLVGQLLDMHLNLALKFRIGAGTMQQ